MFDTTRQRLGSVDPSRQQDFRIRRPLKTHWEDVTCREFGCPNYVQGWMTILPQADDLCDWIRYKSGRHFSERTEGELTEFTFPPGQECFSQLNPKTKHRRPTREPIYEHARNRGLSLVLSGGELTGISGVTRHERPEDWVEHSSEQLDRLRRTSERG